MHTLFNALFFHILAHYGSDRPHLGLWLIINFFIRTFFVRIEEVVVIVTDRLPKIGFLDTGDQPKMDLKQVEQDVSSFFVLTNAHRTAEIPPSRNQ